ncbi:MAG TPA: cellulose binding domain-containing protein [Rugosimonospora sp.]|nr:cellulose binding domain-containing protein [Rugosimonospora sp.]
MATAQAARSRGWLRRGTAGLAGLIAILAGLPAPAAAAPPYYPLTGVVEDSTAAPLAGAVVTLMAVPALGLPQPVPPGSPLLGPDTPNNPVVTGVDGRFGWSASAGNYQIAVSRPGCVPIPGADSASNPFPLPQTYQHDLVFGRDCSGGALDPALSLATTPSPVVVFQPTTFTATVSRPDGSSATGSVRFADVDDPLGEAIPGCERVPLVSGSGSCHVTYQHATQDEAGFVSVLYSGDSTVHATSTRTSVFVQQADPVVTWPTPAPIRYPTPLGPAQLDAVANVPGTFTYTVHATGKPAPGAVLSAGTGQQLDARFTPADPADYRSATAHVAITVLPGPGCAAAYVVSSQWPGGFVSTVTVTAGDQALTGWRVTLTLPGGVRIVKSWDTQVSGTSGVVQAVNLYYNGRIAAGKRTTFGFQGSGDGSGVTASCTPN